MSRINATFSGGVVADPEDFEFSGGGTKRSFPVYVNHSKKNRDTGNYEDTGDVSKIRVALFGDLASTDIRKGDIVEVEGSLLEKEFEKRDGTTGRALQTEYVNSIVVKWRADGANAQPASDFGSTSGDSPF